MRLDIRFPSHDNAAMEQTSGKSGTPQFRGNIPDYRAPDRTEWARKHGAEPYEIKGVPNKFLTRARGAVGRGSSTIKFKDAIDAEVALDEIHDAVAFDYANSPEDLVFFDPQTDSFWGYPEGE